MSETFLSGRVILYAGNCTELLEMMVGNSIDACITDPPYHLTSIVKRFGKADSAPAQEGNDGRFARTSAGFMGKRWDGGDVAFRSETWKDVFRVLKPGAHLVSFGGTRTYHRMACAIEDAGFEIRDCIQWLYGSGFPKSHDVSKGIDRLAGAERAVVGQRMAPRKALDANPDGGSKYGFGVGEIDVTAPATDEAWRWQGWGTALKPACEPIVLARKPLSEKSVAANVLRWGTGALNIDGCRIEMTDDDADTIRNMGGYGRAAYDRRLGVALSGSVDGSLNKKKTDAEPHQEGRWPANVIHDGSEEVIAGFPQSEVGNPNQISGGAGGIWDDGDGKPCGPSYADHGTAARYFYTAKADTDDRLGSKHPTVKPLDLMQYLVRLVTPPRGTVLDPFAGTGTTGEAAWREGMYAVLIEREAEYQADIRRRMALALAGPDERTRESIKARGLVESAGPLFDV